VSGSTQRAEEDAIEWLSGTLQDFTTGFPLAFIIRNKAQRSSDYEFLKGKFRPSHADYAVYRRYGIYDHRGGGRLSGRETTARVVGGAVAKLLLKEAGIDIRAYTLQIGNVRLPEEGIAYTVDQIRSSRVRCPDEDVSKQMEALIEATGEAGDTLGGIVACRIRGVPAGMGDPVFEKLDAELARAMVSIGAVKGVEFGSGFGAATMQGSQHNDPWIFRDGIRTKTNNSGGIQGGISNGEELYFKVAFKPVSSIRKEQELMDVQGRSFTYTGQGRHDVCIVPRAVAVVEAMAALVLADHHLRYKTL
jgi:chorismate synthase